MRKRALLAPLLVLITLVLSVAFVIAYIEFPLDHSPALAASSPSPHIKLPFSFVNRANAPEADEILASVCAGYPDVVAHAAQATLVRFHSGTQMHRNGPGGTQAMAGAYSRVVHWCQANGLSLWGIYERWGPGRYVAVYRVRPLDGWDGNQSCTLEIQSNAGSALIASYIPKPAELKAGQWVDVPVAFTLPQRVQIEFRFWTGTNAFAVDRIYLFQLQ